MVFLQFADVSFRTHTNIGRICEDLNSMIGEEVWHDTFKIQNTNWLYLVNYIVSAINNDESLCVCFGLYTSYVTGILNSLKQINFYVLCNKRLNYVDLLERIISGKECTTEKFTEICFQLQSDEERVLITFVTRTIHGQLPSELVFAHSVLNKIGLSSLVYGIVSVRKRVTYITNQVLTSKHECILDLFGCDFHLPKRLANCKLYTQYCSAHPKSEVFVPETLFCSKKSHRMLGEAQYHCKLCVKDDPGSLKTLCINQLGKFTYYSIKTRKRTNRKCKNRLRFS
jgi:hypothetical protein